MTDKSVADNDNLPFGQVMSICGHYRSVRTLATCLLTRQLRYYHMTDLFVDARIQVGWI